MQNFLSLWLNAGAQITHGGQVQRPRQKNQSIIHMNKYYRLSVICLQNCENLRKPSVLQNHYYRYFVNAIAYIIVTTD